MTQPDIVVNPSGWRAWKWILGAGGMILLLIVAVVGYIRRNANPEQELRGKSMDSLRKLESQQDADALAHFVYAQQLFDAGKSSEAVAPISRAVGALPKSAHTVLAGRIYALAGSIAADGGVDDQADFMLRQAEAIHRDDPLVCLGRGTLALRHDRLADAVSEFTTATRIDGAYAESWKRLGNAYMQGAELDLGLQALRRASALNPKDPAIHMAIGQGLVLVKQFTAAKTEYEAVAALMPDDRYYSTMPIRIIALMARSDADYTRAVEQLQAALTRFPDDDGLRGELAGLYLRFNQFKPARKELETILSHKPMISTDGWYNLYTVCKRLGDQRAAQDARARFQELITLKDAATELTEQARMHPTDARLFLRLSIALLQMRQIDQAYATLRHAASLDPNDPEIAHAMAGAQRILRSRQEQGAGGAGTSQ